MAHPQTAEAVDAPAPVSASDKAADFENFLFGEEETDEQDTETTDEGDENAAEEGEDLELEDEEEGESEDEPDVPAIKPPASLNAAEKAAFEQLPPEAQQAWAAAETRRNTQVQEATTKAAEAQRSAEATAAKAEAAAQAKFAAQLDQFAQALAPQRPDPALAQYDPAAYIAAQAQYEAAKAQHDEFVQQVTGLRTEASQKADEVFSAERAADLMTLPKLANPETRGEYLAETLELVEWLGLDKQSFEQVASSSDFKALEKIGELKAKAEKYDQAMSRKMQRVASHRGKTLRPNAASTETKATKTDKAWGRVKSAGGKTAREGAFADYLEASGIL